jgi:IQ calmodulin-binding motif
MQATQVQRGYAGLDEEGRCNKAATWLQKTYRGRLVRKHMPEVLQAVRAHKRWIPSTIFRMFCGLQASPSRVSEYY